jgi:hypothetical protein
MNINNVYIIKVSSVQFNCFIWFSLDVPIHTDTVREGWAICDIRNNYVTSTQTCFSILPRVLSLIFIPIFLNFCGYIIFGIFSHDITLEWGLYEDKLDYREY